MVGVESFAASLPKEGFLLAEQSLLLLPAIMTILVSASLFFFVPTGWAALPVAVAVMLGVTVPLATWTGLSIFENEKTKAKVIITAMSIAILVGIAAAVLSALFLPSFMPLLMGIILSALAIAPVSFFSLGWAIIGICSIVSPAILSNENTEGIVAMCSFGVSVLLVIAFAVSLLVFCSAQTAMLAIFAVSGGCIALFSISMLVAKLGLEKRKGQGQGQPGWLVMHKGIYTQCEYHINRDIHLPLS
jgi:hypothetical protein